VGNVTFPTAVDAREGGRIGVARLQMPPTVPG
jgi:hypothetical protein